MSGAAIALTVVGCLSEVLGVFTVIREIAADRARARQLLSEPRSYERPQRHYPPPLGRHSFGAGGFGGAGVVASIQRPSLEDQITDLAAQTANALITVRKDVDEERDKLEGALMIEIDKGYNDLRGDLRDLLEGSVRLRLVGVGALLLGIAFSAFGSILGNLN